MNDLLHRLCNLMLLTTAIDKLKLGDMSLLPD